jgi:hypothetical protein
MLFREVKGGKMICIISSKTASRRHQQNLIRLWYAMINSSTIIKLKINRMTTFALFQITKTKGIIEDDFWTKSTDKCTFIAGNWYPSKKNQVLDYFLQYMYSRKLQKYYITLIVSQNIAFVLLIKKKSEKYIKKITNYN